MCDSLTGWLFCIINSVQNLFSPHFYIRSIIDIFPKSVQLVPTFLKTVLLFFNPLVATSWNICGRGSSWSLLSRWHDILKPQFLFFQVSYSESVKTWVISREIQITTQNSHSHLVGLTQWVCGCVFYLMKNIIKSYVTMYSSSATKVNM